MKRGAERLLLSALVAALLLAAPVPARAEGEHALGIQAGWWSVEAEYRAPFGLFIDVGVPWFALVLDGTMDGTDWFAAVGAKLGYQLSLSESWSLRFGVRDAESIWHGCPCVDDNAVTNVKTLVSFEAGARFEAPCGFVVGVDLSLYALMIGDSGNIDHYWPGYSVLFSQAYVGFRWLL
jgi:hypothetical protein